LFLDVDDRVGRLELASSRQIHTWPMRQARPGNRPGLFARHPPTNTLEKWIHIIRYIYFPESNALLIVSSAARSAADDDQI
jgi:hypothetical protein